MGKSRKSKSLLSQSEGLVDKVKDCCNGLKEIIKALPEMEFTLAYERQFEDLCFRESGIF